MSEHPRHALPIGHNIAGYQIVRTIGQGGFGIVYEAKNPVTGERVAVKEFYPSAMATRQEGTIVLHNARESDVYEKVLERFRSTAGAQFQFKHPNILEVYNYIPGANTGYMITEFIDGESLRGFLQKYGGHFPSDDMFRGTMEQVLGAIGYVHRQGHIHRDIAPDNVMVDAFGKPTVIDFGALKRDLRGSNAYSSILMLKEDYAPPEQHDTNLAQGYYTDIFALAGTMYCALTGSPPPRATSRFLSPTGDSYIPIAQASKIPCPPEVFETIDAGLRLVARDRPQTIEEFASNLGWDPNYGSATKPSEPATTFRDDGATRAIIREPGAAVLPSAGGETKRPPATPPAPPPSAPVVEAPKRKLAPAYLAAVALAVLLLMSGVWAMVQWGPLFRSDSTPTTIPVSDKKSGPNVCEQLAPYQKALGGGVAALRDYLKQCPSGPFVSLVEQNLAREEDRLYNAALSCIRAASCGRYEACEQTYTTDFPAGVRLAEIKRAADAHLANCRKGPPIPRPADPSTQPPPVTGPPVPKPPPPQVIPNGTYRAVRGYNTPRGAQCLARYTIPAVNIRNGSISFESDSFLWEGTIDQTSGHIEIPNSRIINRKTGRGSQRGLSISGNYRNAVLQSGECGPGFFRIEN